MPDSGGIMGRPSIDITGQRFGSLTVEKISGKYRDGSNMWMCLCDCGNQHEAPSMKLLGGRSLSCGCRRTTHGATRFHNQSTTYKRWLAMKNRVARHPHYKNISICERWKESFETFVFDIGLCPSDSHTLDRIDGSGNYEKENCRWATVRENIRNRDVVRDVEWCGRSFKVPDLANDFGVPARIAQIRIWRGWDALEACITPVQEKQ